VLTTTLAAETGGRIDRTLLVREVLRSLEHWYGVFLENEGDVLKEWETLNMTIGSRVKVSAPGETIEGMAQGIDSDGRLLITQDDGRVRTVAAGDVTIVKR
jgi:BirA family biotin operon repressor/biotin-[acetyl-CoA-carboxylase] ligase